MRLPFGFCSSVSTNGSRTHEPIRSRATALDTAKVAAANGISSLFVIGSSDARLRVPRRGQPPARSTLH
jgi:hypothetical protein